MNGVIATAGPTVPTVPTMRILIKLQCDRSKPGTIEVYDGTDLIMRRPCLGMSGIAKRHNPNQNPLQLFGPVPVGGYVIAGFFEGYGCHPVVGITGVSGDALTSRQYGRSELKILGGELKDGCLRPTFSGVRVSNGTLAEINLCFENRGATTGEVLITEE